MVYQEGETYSEEPQETSGGVLDKTLLMMV
jgi:hypothetical protein